MNRQLTTVLMLRRRVEDEAIRDLAAAEAVAHSCRVEADAATLEAGRPVDGNDAGAFTVAHDLAARRQLTQRLAAGQVAAADQVTAEALAAYQAARVRTEMIRRLIERKALEANEEALVLEQKQIDDVAASRWARQHA